MSPRFRRGFRNKKLLGEGILALADIPNDKRIEKRFPSYYQIGAKCVRRILLADFVHPEYVAAVPERL